MERFSNISRADVLVRKRDNEDLFLKKRHRKQKNKRAHILSQQSYVHVPKEIDSGATETRGTPAAFQQPYALPPTVLQPIKPNQDKLLMTALMAMGFQSSRRT